VAEATGRPLSDWQADTRPTLAADLWRGVVLNPPREALYARCDARVAGMVREGVLDEVARLARRDLDSVLPVMKAVGYRWFAAHVNGGLTLDEAVNATAQDTRRYAKRQMTWFRNQARDWDRIEGTDSEAQADRLFRIAGPARRLSAGGATE
jgi:tRNA dimethylallyltransferase